MNEQRVTSLRQEASDVFNVNASKAARVDQLTAVTIAGGGAAYGVSFVHPVITLVIAPVAIVLLTYALQIIGDVISLGLYRKYLENELNQELGVPTVIWETGVVRVRHGGKAAVSVPLVQVIVVAEIATLAGFSAFIGVTQLHVWIWVPYIVLLLAALTALMLAFIESQKLFRDEPQVINDTVAAERTRLGI